MKKVFEHFQSELFLQQCLIFVGAAKPYFRCLSKNKLLVGDIHTSLFFWKVSVYEESFVKLSLGAIFSDKYYILVELNLILVRYLSG